MRLAVYGGSFDPPHVAHVLVAAYALAVGNFDRLLVVPVFAHAFDKRLTPFEDRVAMCERAFAELRRVEVSRIESRLGVPSRTLTTLEALRAEHPDAELALVIGSDVLSAKDKWYRFDDVCRLAPPFVVERSGYEHPGVSFGFSLPDVSSTHVRALLATEAESAERELRRLVPSRVLEYARARGLYGKGSSTSGT
ncbi:MAG TPA: nicotinate-nicotinamide nucleotide adenylyltransferase [Polyangiaceae bacterium]|nr:nicotinate-nicotinamide nucleotide adenylyltransferase [Polyangiaceae bacterium]